MIRYDECLEIIARAAAERSSLFRSQFESVRIENSVGRTVAQEIVSTEVLPPFNNSSMDGFALRAELTKGASIDSPLQFRVLGKITAGMAPIAASSQQLDTTWEIMTGAPIPDGFDCVVKAEDTVVVKNSAGEATEILVSKPLAPKENFRAKGADFLPGQRVFASGTLLMPEHVLALASLGVADVQVRRNFRVALISSGAELVEHSEKLLRAGMIRNSTAPHLLSALASFGAECCYQATSSDDPGDFRQLLREARACRPDVVITTGAVSKGCHDFIPDVIVEEGANILFHGVAIRPGKPGLFAELPAINGENAGPVIFGVPGNPVSTAVGLRFFVSRYLEALRGSSCERPLRARLLAKAEKPTSLRCFFKARLGISEEGKAEVTCLGGQPSFMVSPLLNSNAWVIFPEEGSSVEEGTMVDVYPLYPLAYDYAVSAPPALPRELGACC